MTVVLAVGLDAEGELKCLYAGQDYSRGEAALYEAGALGRISEGWVYRDPSAVLHQWYSLSPQEEEVPRRGRPLKVVS